MLCVSFGQLLFRLLHMFDISFECKNPNIRKLNLSMRTNFNLIISLKRKKLTSIRKIYV